MSIYTRTGDKGTTALFGGKRVLKCNELVDVYGSLDELNSWIGLVTSQLPTIAVKEFFSCVQSDLFTIGSVFAGADVDITYLNGRIDEMEARIDSMEEALPKLKNFILPGGSVLGASIHIVRAVCRRVERQAVALDQTQHINSDILKYLNRLSDLLFVLGRFVNMEHGEKEMLWRGIDQIDKKK